MKITRVLLCIFLPLIAAPTYAADLMVTWKNGTTFSDGTAMAATEITKSEVSCGLSQTNQTLFATAQAAATAVTVQGGLTGKTYVCGVATFTKSNGNSAVAFSNNGTVPLPKPSPPTDVGLSIPANGGTAYSVIKSQDALVMLPVGTVSPATMCDASQAVQIAGRTYNAVPVSSVKFTGTAKPIVAFALCS